MAHPRFRINLLEDERDELQALVDAPRTPQFLVRRARIVLLANGECRSNREIAEALKIHKSDITVWTKRWIERIFESVLARLSDRARSGRPPRIDAEQ